MQTIEESSFETLEALAHHTAWRVYNIFLYPAHRMFSEPNYGELHSIKICLEKPTAVTFADAPAVEFTLTRTSKAHSNDSHHLKARLPPFPLEGRLDIWIRKTYPDH